VWWQPIVSLLLGITGWFATSFLARPWLDFLNLRSQVHEEIIFTVNAGPMTVHTPDYEKAVESLRRLGAKVQATDVTAPRLLRRFLSKCGYDLTMAGGNLIGLSNSLNLPARYLHADKIEKGLRLPRTSNKEFLDSIRKEISRGSPSG